MLASRLSFVIRDTRGPLIRSQKAIFASLVGTSGSLFLFSNLVMLPLVGFFIFYPFWEHYLPNVMTFSARMTLTLCWVEMALVGILTGKEEEEETSLIYGVMKEEETEA